MEAFHMPSLGADMEAGTLVEWLKQPGDAVKRGDVIAVVDTQKGAIEIEVFNDGIVDSQLVDVGTTVPVGTPLAMIRGEGEVAGGGEPPPTPVPPVREAEAAAPPAPPSAAEPAHVPEAVAAPGVRRSISPAARRLAESRGIDIASLSGTGPGGVIELADVAAALGGAPEAQKRAAEPMSGMRGAIAAAMARSKREIPHYYLSNTIDLTRADAHVAGHNADRPPDERILVAALFVKAVALACGKYPEFSGHFEDGRFHPAEIVHVGVAINIRGGGLVAPAIHDTASLTIEALMAAMRDLVARVRAGRFRATELSDPTITVSSLGERGVDALFGVIYPPQVAIVGFGMPAERPWIENGTVAPRRIVTATLAADHRVSDGHRGALFLNEIDRLLQEPEKL